MDDISNPAVQVVVGGASNSEMAEVAANESSNKDVREPEKDSDWTNNSLCPPEQDYLSDSSDYDEYEEAFVDSLLEESLEPPVKKARIHEEEKETEAAATPETDSKSDQSNPCTFRASASNEALKRPNVHRYTEPEVIESGIRVAAHVVTKKVVLKKKNSDSFEVLPEGWMELTHFSGMPVYLHRQTRVCSLSKPYYLGPASVRKHEVPLSAIPCLQYRREKEREQKELEEMQGQESDTPLVKLESLADSKKKNSLNFMDVRAYCSANLFEFEEIAIRKFKTWADRRAHSMLRKERQRPSLPEGTKLIKVPIIPKPPKVCNSSSATFSCDVNSQGESSQSAPVSNSTSKAETHSKGSPNKQQGKSSNNSFKGNMQGKKEFILNPAGKSHVCILHEFAQHCHRVQPQYKYQELENASTPYSATVIINNVSMGTGFGPSKKIAKSEAAKKTLQILIPEYDSKIASTEISATGKATPSDGVGSTSRSSIESGYLLSGPSTSTSRETSAIDFSFFNDVKITDDRVTDLCNTAAQPGPYQILVECLARNHGFGDTDIHFSVSQSNKRKLKNQFTMKVGKHEVTGLCKNSRLGKQKASQLMLQKLHPNLSSWGSLLMMYGRGSAKTPKEKREDERHITELQGKASAHKPNYAILDKLKEEMRKLKTKMDAGEYKLDRFGDLAKLSHVDL